MSIECFDKCSEDEEVDEGEKIREGKVYFVVNDHSVMNCMKEISLCSSSSDYDSLCTHIIDRKFDKVYSESASFLSLHLDILAGEVSNEKNCSGSKSMVKLPKNIPHVDRFHGFCRSIPCGFMHVFYQLLISIEKETLVPVTLSNKLFKSLIDDYGLRVIDMSRFEEELRVGIFMKELSNSSGTLIVKEISQELLDVFKNLLITIGVPSYFPFILKHVYLCLECKNVSNQVLVQHNFLLLEADSPVTMTSLSEIMW
jgi:hypothetical protein